MTANAEEGATSGAAKWCLLVLITLAGCLPQTRVTVEAPETECVLAEGLPTIDSANQSSSETAIADLGDPPARFDHSQPARDWQYVVLHHSGASIGSVASIDEEHRSRSDSEGRHWLGIGYHFVIGNGRGMDDGEVQPTFRWRQQLAGAHAGVREYNEGGIGICLIGDFRQQPPSERQVAACERLVADLCNHYEVPSARVIRHSDVKATECPGRQFPYAAVANAAQQRGGALPRTSGRHGTTQRY